MNDVPLTVQEFSRTASSSSGAHSSNGAIGPAPLAAKARQGAGPSRFPITGRGAIQSSRSSASTARSFTALVKPCAQREAAASRAPSVASDDGTESAAMGVALWMLIPIGAEPTPNSPRGVLVGVGGADRLYQRFVFPQSAQCFAVQ